MTRFEDILLQYSNMPWEWRQVSANPSVSLQFILDNPQLPWDVKYVSRNINITEQDVLNNLNYPWNYEGLCMNPNISLKFFNDYIIKPDVVHRVDWHHLSSNPSITMLDIINYPKYAWDDKYLSSNPNLTSNFILNEGKDRKWFVPFISSNPGITARDIFKSTLKNMFDWDYKNLSANVNLPIVYVNDNLDKPWNFHSISTNVSINDLEKFHQIPWDAHGLSINKNITFNFVKNHPKVKWHLPSLLSNSSIDFKTIMNNYSWFANKWTEKNIIEMYLSSNATITNEWIMHTAQNIDWKRLSSNPLF